MTQAQRAAGGTQLFSTVLSARFSRLPAGGFDMTLRTTTNRTSGSALFGVMMRSFAAIEPSYRLAADGQPVAVLDADESWAKLSAAVSKGVAMVRTARGPAGPQTRALAGYAAAFSAMPPAARAEALLGNARALTGFAVPSLRVGEQQPYRAGGADAGGGGAQLSGTLRRLPSAAGTLRFRIETAGTGETGASLLEMREIVISAADGLLKAETHTLRNADDRAPFFTQTVTRLP